MGGLRADEEDCSSTSTLEQGTSRPQAPRGGPASPARQPPPQRRPCLEPDAKEAAEEQPEDKDKDSSGGAAAHTSCESTSSSFAAHSSSWAAGGASSLRRAPSASTPYEYGACLALAQLARESRKRPSLDLPGGTAAERWGAQPERAATSPPPLPPPGGPHLSLEALPAPEGPGPGPRPCAVPPVVAVPTAEAKQQRLEAPLESPRTPDMPRRPRLRWTALLHTRFVFVVNSLGGPYKASQGDIQRRMNVTGLTVDHVKSHLQKYRARLRAERGPAAAPEAQSGVDDA